MNQTTTQSESGANFSEDAHTAFVASLSCLSILIVATNTCVCCLVYLNKTIRTCTNGIVVSLAISDIIVGAVFFPLHLAVPTFPGNSYITAISLLVGVSNVVCVTYDRYLSISSPLTYTMDIQQLFKRMIVLCWFIPITFSLIPLMWSANPSYLPHRIYLFVMEICGVIIPYVFIFAVYFYIFKQVKKCSKRLQTELTDQQTMNTKRSHLFFELKVARVFIVIASIFLLCWAPLLFITTAHAVGYPQIASAPYLHIISFYMIALDSVVNPLIYCFLKPDIQSAIRRTLKKARRHEMTIRFQSKAIDTAGIIIRTSSNTNLRASNTSSGQFNHVN